MAVLRCGMNLCRLSDNKLVRLPATMSALVQLTRLELDGNELEELPSFAGMARLSKLELRDNRLAAADLTGLTLLRRLDCSQNRLRELPSGVPQMCGPRRASIVVPPATGRGLGAVLLSSQTITVSPPRPFVPPHAAAWHASRAHRRDALSPAHTGGGGIRGGAGVPSKSSR
jgi:hypothetical protein